MINRTHNISAWESEKGRLDWKALGYRGDPMDSKNR